MRDDGRVPSSPPAGPSRCGPHATAAGGDPDAAALFAGPGAVRARCRALDWAATPLGPVAAWPGALRAAVRLCLDCARPMGVFGGPALVCLYNDAYAAAVGAARHPQALGRPAHEAWADLWDLLAPEYAQVMAGGPPVVRDQDLRYDVDRGRGPEETHWTYATSPIRDDDGRVVGCQTLITETTARVRAEAARARHLEEAEAARAAADLDRRRLLAVLEQLPVGVHVAEADGRLVLDNAALRAICGEAPRSTRVADYSADYAGHYPPRHARAGAPLASDAWPLARALATGVPVDGELVEVRRPDGTPRLVRVSATPVRDADGRVVGGVAASVDVTERERLLAEAEAARAAAERTAAALAASEAKYRTLFESIDEGFCVVEVLFDGERAVDYRFLEANTQFERQTGLRDAVGRRMRDLAPAHEPHWFATYGRIARTGTPERFEQQAAALGRWYDVYAFRVGAPEERRVAILFRDVTDRRRADAALRDREAQQAFLLGLSDALRACPDEPSIKALTVQMLAEHLRLDRCWISEVFAREGISTVGPEHARADLAPLTGVFRLVEYPETMRQLATEPMVVSDVVNDPRFSDAERTLLAGLHLRALLVAPLREGQRPVIWAFAAATATPRQWTDGERLLLEEVAERTWGAVERARAEAAVRASEEQYRALFTEMDEAYAVVDVLTDDTGRWTDFRFVEVNPAFMRHTGMPNPVGRTATELLGTPNPRWAELYGRAAETGESIRVEESELTLGRTFDLNIFRLGGPGSRRVAVLFTDVTDRKRAEAALAAGAAR